MCKLDYQTCNCEDCKEVKELYSNLEWLEQDREFNHQEIKEIENKIESMGYFV